MAGLIRGQLEHLKPILECWVAPSGIGEGHFPRGMKVRALIDTGATHIVLRQMHVDALGLQANGSVVSTNVGAIITSESYSVDLIFEGVNTSPDHILHRFTVTGAMATVSEFHQDFDIILGMHVLQHLGLHFDRSGNFKVDLPG